MDVYYLNKERYEKGDTIKGLKFALKLAKEDANIDTISFLVLQSNQYEPFLGELGLSEKVLKSHYGKCGNYKVQFHTVKTYNPSYAIAGQGSKEILVAVGVPSNYIEKFEDRSNIKACIIIPWLLSENQSILNVYEAIDIETGKAIEPNYKVDNRVVNAIEWLKSTSSPNEGYHHPLDENRLHAMANALAHYNVPLDHDSVVYTCLNHGLIPSAARKTADAFVKAKERKLIVRFKEDNPMSFLKEMMETEHD